MDSMIHEIFLCNFIVYLHEFLFMHVIFYKYRMQKLQHTYSKCIGILMFKNRSIMRAKFLPGLGNFICSRCKIFKFRMSVKNLK